MERSPTWMNISKNVLMTVFHPLSLANSMKLLIMFTKFRITADIPTIQLIPFRTTPEMMSFPQPPRRHTHQNSHYTAPSRYTFVCLK